ncbi:MAG: DUF4920 domain-containing protein [Myxococcota bacterium]
MRSLATILATCSLPLFVACQQPLATPPVSTGAELGASSQPAPSSAAPATPGKGEDPKERDQVDEDGVVRRGEKLSEAKDLSVTEALAQAKGLDGTSVKIAGTVDQVCAKKGCWFVLRADDEAHKGDTIRITSKGYRFFMPRSSVGQRAIVEGDLKVTTLTQAEAQHLEDDRVEAEGGEAKKISGEQVELQLAAVAVEMRPAGG